ncbi:MAG: hypothetical protein U0992_09400 [Planctomycetaceae bacterium]
MIAWEEPDLLTAERLAALREFARNFREPELFCVEQHLGDAVPRHTQT